MGERLSTVTWEGVCGAYCRYNMDKIWATAYGHGFNWPILIFLHRILVNAGIIVNNVRRNKVILLGGDLESELIFLIVFIKYVSLQQIKILPSTMKLMNYL